jgi:hypothetical protein
LFCSSKENAIFNLSYCAERMSSGAKAIALRYKSNSKQRDDF